MRHIMFLVLTLACVVEPLPAQIARTDRAGLNQPSGVAGRGRPQIVMPRADGGSYWKEGGAVTSLITVIAMNIWARDATSKERLFGSIVLGGVFFVPGALIGGQIKKD